MPDSFILPNLNTSPPQANSNPATGLQLSDVATQQQDAIIFEGSRIPGIASANEGYLIFYLAQEDEVNGFGTIIQLDPTTKQAAIFADLNPEYTYLFYNNDQGQIQTMLWCIEFATRTPEGLYVTQAKVYGKGLTEADMQRLNQIQLPSQATTQPQHPLAEASPLLPPTQAGTTQAAAPTSPPAQAAPQQPLPPPPPLWTEPTTPEPTQTSTQPAPLPPLSLAEEPAPAPATNPTATTWTQPTPQATGLNLPPLPTGPTTSEPVMEASPLADPISNLADPQPLPEPQPDWNQPRPAQPPTTQSSPDPEQPMSAQWQTQPSGSDTVIPTPAVTNNDQTAQTAEPTAAQSPTPAASQVKPLWSQQPPQQAQSNPDKPTTAVKQPVGRPPKPLTQDQVWMIEPQDFTWLKHISRQPLAANQEELRQKIMKQIRKNRPALIDDWQFHGAFELAFQAVAQTYELVPSLRHDLLKSLLNGKVIDQIVAQQQRQV